MKPYVEAGWTSEISSCPGKGVHSYDGGKRNKRFGFGHIAVARYQAFQLLASIVLYATSQDANVAS